LNITIKYSQTEKGLVLIFDYGSYFLCLLATLLGITFPIFSAFFTYACMYG